MAHRLRRALPEYTQAKGRGKPTIDAHEALAALREHVVRDMPHGVDFADFRHNAWQRPPAVADHVLGVNDGKRRFADAVLAASRAYVKGGVFPECEQRESKIDRRGMPREQGSVTDGEPSRTRWRVPPARMQLRVTNTLKAATSATAAAL